MMDYEEFKQQVVDNVKDYLPIEFADADVNIRQVTKNNDTVIDTLYVIKGNEPITPAIHLNESYLNYAQTQDFESEIRKLAQLREMAPPVMALNPQGIANFETAKEKLDCRIINFEKNKEYLKDKPYRQVEDLAMVYCVDLSMGKGDMATTVVTYPLLDMWGVSKEEVNDKAMENLKNNDGFQFKSLWSVLKDSMFPELPDDDPTLKLMLPPQDGPAMYVLSNEQKCYGAKFLLDTDRMDEIAKQLNGDFIILPSSVNEVIIMPNADTLDREMFEQMIHQVNTNEVPDKDILSDHVYCYDAIEHELMRGDRYQEKHAEIQMEQPAEKQVQGMLQTVGEEKVGYAAKSEEKSFNTAKPERSGGSSDRRSVKDQISEKKAIIDKQKPEKAAPIKNHHQEL